ncbi:MAG: carbon starvation protein A [Fidelibacterota bacterium]
MSSVTLALVSIGLFFLGYRFYSRWIGEKIYALRDKPEILPAHEFRDGMDYVPTKKHILFGHHYTSIAGAAPIIGPCVAAFWGWLPAILWVVLGTIFMGAVHDFGALVTSVREKGNSIADISSSVLNGRVRLMFLSFVILLIWLVLAVFAMAIADLFVGVPTSVIPINIGILVALAVGWLIYKRNFGSLIPSLAALFILYFFVWIGSKVPVDFTVAESAGGLGMAVQDAKNLWIILLLVYSAIASLLPVWTLLQPRDYINSHQLLVGLGLLFLGIFIAQPVVDAPALRTLSDPGAPPIFPLLFVTIACGAISGFHGLVASGTTSKQLNKFEDSRLIGYGGMIGEGTLALASTIAAVAGIALVSSCTLPAVGAVHDLSWGVYYDSWAHASSNKAAAFVLGGGALLESVGLSHELAKTLMAVLVISFAATTLDTATRIQRFILGEFGKVLKVRPLTNRYFATAIAILPACLLAFWNVSDPGTGVIKQAGWILWPIFGASNQMLAALTLMILTLYYWQRKKPVLPLLIPMVFITVVTCTALIGNALRFYATNWVLFFLTLILMGMIVWMLVEGVLKVYFILKVRLSS